MAFENTLPAFKEANKRVQSLEFDVQLTKDHVPVICHDDNLTRLCGQDVYVSQLFYKDLPLLKSGDTIPTFFELIHVCPNLFLHIEIKNQQAYPFVRDHLPHRCLVSSFHHNVIEQASNDVKTLWLVEGKAPKKWQDKTCAQFLGLEKKHLYNPFINPKNIFLYTINSNIEINLARFRGFSGVYCDYAEHHQNSVLSNQ